MIIRKIQTILCEFICFFLFSHNVFTINRILTGLLIGLLQIRSLGSVEVNCETDLRMGQYLCIPSQQVDPKTQQIKGCTKENVAKSEFARSKL